MSITLYSRKSEDVNRTSKGCFEKEVEETSTIYSQSIDHKYTFIVVGSMNLSKEETRVHNRILLEPEYKDFGRTQISSQPISDRIWKQEYFTYLWNFHDVCITILVNVVVSVLRDYLTRRTYRPGDGSHKDEETYSIMQMLLMLFIKLIASPFFPK